MRPLISLADALRRSLPLSLGLYVGLGAVLILCGANALVAWPASMAVACVMLLCVR